MNLPIHISQEELQENPGFASLLLDLSTNHLTKEGVSKEKADKLDYVWFPISSFDFPLTHLVYIIITKRKEIISTILTVLYCN